MLTPFIILVLLAAPWGLALLISGRENALLNRQKYACWGLGLAFIFFFIGHFVKTQGMVEMLPAWIPWRVVIIYVTGVLELIIGFMLFVPSLQKVAAKLAIVIFVLFFPANIYAAINYIGLGGHQWGPIYLFIRAPLQIILIGWAWFLCINNRSGLKSQTDKPVKNKN